MAGLSCWIEVFSLVNVLEWGMGEIYRVQMIKNIILTQNIIIIIIQIK